MWIYCIHLWKPTLIGCNVYSSNYREQDFCMTFAMFGIQFHYHSWSAMVVLKSVASDFSTLWEYIASLLLWAEFWWWWNQFILFLFHKGPHTRKWRSYCPHLRRWRPLLICHLMDRPAGWSHSIGWFYHMPQSIFLLALMAQQQGKCKSQTNCLFVHAIKTILR